MANPSYPSDGQNERVDAVVTASGLANLKLGIGSVTPSGATTPASWHGVATHVEAATSGATDGIVVIGGKVAAGAAVVHSLLVDAAGRPIVVGAAAAASAVAGNPVLIGGSDGTNAQNIAVDTSGRQKVVGAVATGSSASGVNPILAAGYDGTNAQSLATDTLGHPITAGEYLTIFKTVQATASGNTAIWTPTTGKKFRLKRIHISIGDDATITSGGHLAITFQDATTAIGLGFDTWLASAAGTADGIAFDVPMFDLGFGYLSSAANNVLNVNLSSALSGGSVRVTVAGTEE